MSSSVEAAPHQLGPYELVQRIATGGMAEVYLARRAGPRGFQKVVALKRILPQFAQDPEFVAMFVDEARVCARLGHPNVVQVFDFGDHEGELYMAMEFVDGTTGAKLIRSAASSGEDIPLHVSLHIALSILRGLDYAHNVRDESGTPLKLVHRDVSPGNVLIDCSGAVKLTDFGIARASEIERRTDAGQLKGKLGYMSPEQVVGKELDARSDIFTAGIVLAELVMLRPLFAGPSEIDVLMRIRDADLRALDRCGDRVPSDIKAVLYRALTKDRAARFPTAAAFAEALEEIVRRRRLQIGPAKLAALLGRLGLVTVLNPVDALDSQSVPTARMQREERFRSSMLPPAESEQTPAIYRLQRPSGEVIGPVSYPRLVEMFATGRVPNKSKVSREQGTFLELVEVPELQRFVQSRAMMQPDEPTSKRASAMERINRAKLPQLLYRLVTQRQTGALSLQDGPRRKTVYVAEGMPEYIVSTDRSELLGEFLIERGQLLRMEVEMALAMLPRFEGRFGEALIGLGVLRPNELVRAIHQQTQDRFAEVLHWRSGDLAFVPGERSHEETMPLALEPLSLIARGVRLGYTPEDVELILAPIGEDLLEPLRPHPVRLEWYRFAEREERVIRFLEQPVALARFVSLAEARHVAEREEILRAVFLGLSAGVLRSERFFDIAERFAD